MCLTSYRSYVCFTYKPIKVTILKLLLNIYKMHLSKCILSPYKSLGHCGLVTITKVLPSQTNGLVIPCGIGCLFGSTGLVGSSIRFLVVSTGGVVVGLIGFLVVVPLVSTG